MPVLVEIWFGSRRLPVARTSSEGAVRRVFVISGMRRSIGCKREVCRVMGIRLINIDSARIQLDSLLRSSRGKVQFADVSSRYLAVSNRRDRGVFGLNRNVIYLLEKCKLRIALHLVQCGVR